MRLERFSESDFTRIKKAVKLAEEKVSGEIVPVIVGRSSIYKIAHYRSSIIAMVLAFIAIIVTDSNAPTINSPISVFTWVFIAMLIGGGLPYLFPGIKRLLISHKQIEESTRQRAESAFLNEEVFNTRHRTGIMIFVSLFEREVIIMADRGISKVVDKNQWEKIVTGLIQQLKKNKVLDGMEKAIVDCGEILYAKGFFKSADDVNELRDDLRPMG